MQVFISHSYQDEKIARELSSYLSAAGLKPWLAFDQVLLGENLPLVVGKALERSDAFVVLISPDAVESPNVRGEISYAFSSSRFEGRVIPVVVRATKDIPWFLQKLPMMTSRSGNSQGLKEVAAKIVRTLRTKETEKPDDLEIAFAEPKMAHR